MPLRSKNKTRKRKPVKQVIVLPDLLYILGRRKRTVESFLKESNASTKEELRRLLADLKKEYHLSPEFLKQAQAAVVGVPQPKKQKPFKQTEEG